MRQMKDKAWILPEYSFRANGIGIKKIETNRTQNVRAVRDRHSTISTIC